MSTESLGNVAAAHNDIRLTHTHTHKQTYVIVCDARAVLVRAGRGLHGEARRRGQAHELGLSVRAGCAVHLCITISAKANSGASIPNSPGC